MSEHVSNRKIGRSAYRAGCRCADCKADNARWVADYDARRRANGGQPLGRPILIETNKPRIEIQIEQTIARTGSVAATMRDLNLDYETVVEVWRAMCEVAA
jgi:hypothetical protein